MFNGRHRVRVRFAIKGRVEGYCLVSYPNGAEDLHNCVIDTGAIVTTIPQKFWSVWITKEEIEKKPKTYVPGTIRGVGGVINAVFCQLLLEISGREDLDESFGLGKCMVALALDQDAADQGEKRKPMTQVLFGAGGGSLDKGGLCINWKEKEAYFVEVDDV